MEAWIQDGSLELPEVRKMPTAEDKRHPKYCHFHRVTTHPTKACYTLRKIFDRRLQKGEIILEDTTVEGRSFPHHEEEVLVVTSEPGGSGVQIEEIEEETPEESTGQLVQALLKTKLFDSFFNQLDFQEKARKEETKVHKEQQEIVIPKDEPQEQANLLEEVNLSDDPKEPRTVLISKELTGNIRAAVINTLKENKDVFAWSYEEMPGLDPLLVTHKLGVEPNKKPKNGTIRCCIDYRDLNKACPKDEFPLPNIDMMVDATAGHEMFSFMDGFSGYNQIRMAPEDAEKTAFRTPFGNFHYVVMPFGLKNAGATYQRTMTAIFHDMIHDIVEDYVDDLVVKSRYANDHVAHLKKVFDRC
ncbi:hypothetical protein UlMin_005912 [Ulmus minor]